MKLIVGKEIATRTGIVVGIVPEGAHKGSVIFVQCDGGNRVELVMTPDEAMNLGIRTTATAFAAMGDTIPAIPLEETPMVRLARS